MISDLKIVDIRAERSIFELNTNYSQTEANESDLNFNINVLVNEKDESRGIIRLGCEVNMGDPGAAPFSLEVMMLGEFSSEGKPFKDYIINSISLLFPYLRAHVSTLTSISGVDPLIIPAVNIIELLKKNTSEAE